MFFKKQLCLLPKRENLILRQLYLFYQFNPLNQTLHLSNISEDELTEPKGGDTDSNLPIVTLSKVSTSPGSPTLDPQGDIPRSDLSGEVRQLSDNSSSDESDRVFHTLSPSQGQEGNMGSPMPILTLPTSPLPEEHFRLLNRRFHPLKVMVEGKCLARVLRMSQV